MLIHSILNFLIGIGIINFAINAMYGSLYIKLIFILSYIIYLIGSRIIFKKMIDKVNIHEFYIIHSRADIKINMKYYYNHKIIISCDKQKNNNNWFDRDGFNNLVNEYTNKILYWDYINYFSPIIIVNNV